MCWNSNLETEFYFGEISVEFSNLMSHFIFSTEYETR